MQYFHEAIDLPPFASAVFWGAIVLVSALLCAEFLAAPIGAAFGAVTTLIVREVSLHGGPWQ